MNGLNIPIWLSVAQKDIKIFLKERGTLFYLFVVPMLFILAFGSTVGMGSGPKEEAIPLPIVNLDEGSQASGSLMAALNQVGGIQCNSYEAAMANTALDR